MSCDNDLPHDDNVYRVYVNPHTNTVEVSCIGMEVDSAVSGEYPSFVDAREGCSTDDDPIG